MMFDNNNIDNNNDDNNYNNNNNSKSVCYRVHVRLNSISASSANYIRPSLAEKLHRAKPRYDTIRGSRYIQG